MFEFFANASKSGSDSKVFQVGAGVERGLGGKGRKGDGRVETFIFKVDAKDGFTVGFGRQVDE